MKSPLYIAIVVLLSFGSTLAQNEDIRFQDTAFKKALIDLNIDGGDGEISYDEAKSVTSLSISGKMISKMPEIQYFTNLKVLNCYNNQLTTLNVSGLTKLQKLYCDNNQLITLKVSGLSNLETLNCRTNQLTDLNVSGLTNLKNLDCYDNNLIMIDLRQTSLQQLFASFNPLQCVVIDSGGMPGYDYDLSDSLYTTEPCLATFETLTHLVKNSNLMNF